MQQLRNSRYWSEAEGRRAVEAWRRSGESAAAFAKRHGLRATRLSYWAKRIDESGAENRVHFVRALVTGPTAEATVVSAVIRGANGVTIELASATAAQVAEVALAVGRSS